MTVAERETVVVQATAEEARELTDRIKLAVDGTWHLVKQAYESRAWSALGYSSWDDYCTREFGSSRLRLPREERQEVVASLRESGLSIRAIAAATGDSKDTVQRALSGVSNETPESENEEEDVAVVETPPPAVTGTDGKLYPIRPKPKDGPAPEPKNSPTAARRREERLREMVAEGYTSSQIAKELDVGVQTVVGIAQRIGVEIHADKTMGKTRRHDASRILNETVSTLEAVAMSLAVIDIDQLDPADRQQWAASLTDSLRSLNRFAKKLKETTQ